MLALSVSARNVGHWLSTYHTTGSIDERDSARGPMITEVDVRLGLGLRLEEWIHEFTSAQRETEPIEMSQLEADPSRHGSAEQGCGGSAEQDSGATDVPLHGVDAIVGVVPSEEGRGGLRIWLEQACRLLKPDGLIVLGLAASEVTTLVKPAAQGLHVRFGRSIKRRGYLAIALRPPRRSADAANLRSPVDAETRPEQTNASTSP